MNSLQFSHISPYTSTGRVLSVSGTSITAELPFVSLGDMVKIERSGESLLAQVVSFNENQVLLAPLGPLGAISPGAKVVGAEEDSMLHTDPGFQGALLDAFGNIVVTRKNKTKIDPAFQKFSMPKGSFPFSASPKPVLERIPISQKLDTGIRSLDTFTTLGKGQRIVILAEPGVGKSSLILSLAEHVQADLVVVALIGERGREVSEFYQELSESEALERTILVASTSDEPAPVRAQAAETAIRIAEIAADQGAHVLLAFDSLSRYLRSLRDIGLSAGELPIRRGYPASVFEKIPKMIERAGAFSKGSITGLYTMLATSEIDEDPLVEEVKGLTDGHLILTRTLSEQGHFPALDIRKSLSRLQRRFWNEEELKIIKEIKVRYAELLDSRDLLMVAGSHDLVRKKDEELFQINTFLRQENKTCISDSDLKKQLSDLYEKLFLAREFVS
jgi:FliI/YscN family ATPase